jgi:hypothetical protein
MPNCCSLKIENSPQLAAESFNRAVYRRVPGCVVLGKADKRCLVIVFLYHVSNVDGKQDFLLLCRSLSYPFCLDTPSRVRYFLIDTVGNSCFSGDRLGLLFHLRTIEIKEVA